MKLLLPLALAATPLAAGAQSFDLGEIVVSANLEPTAVNKVGATVDVVTQQDLQDAAQGSVANALAFQPGITITPKGGVGQQAYVSVRGAPSYDVAVLVDGIDVTDPSGPQITFDFGHLATAGIQSIEILKGSQSALYGSSAVGGVIDITSRHATEDGVHYYTAAEVGTYGTANLSFATTVKTKDSDLAITLSHSGTDGTVGLTGSTANGKKDGYWSNRISANGSHTFANGVKLGFAGFAEANHGEYDPAAGAAVTAYQTGDTAGARVYAEFTTGAVENTISATVFRNARDYVRSDYGLYALTGTRQKLTYQGAVSLGAKSRLVFGADTARETYTDNYGTAIARHIAGVFTELSYSPTDKLDLTASLRDDHQSTFGNAVTGRLSAAWRPQADLTVRASAGTGIRAPSPYELYAPYGLGNPNLTPEKSKSADLGIEKQFGPDSYIRATAFWLQAHNLIDYIYIPSNKAYSYIQVPGTSRRQGLELEGATKLGAATLTAAYTYTDSAASATSSWAAVPRHTIALTASTPLTEKLTGSVSALAGLSRPNGMANYTVAGAGLDYKVTDRIKAYVRVENLFDAKYQLVQNYAMPGRSIYVGLRADF